MQMYGQNACIQTHHHGINLFIHLYSWTFQSTHDLPLAVNLPHAVNLLENDACSVKSWPSWSHQWRGCPAPSHRRRCPWPQLPPAPPQRPPPPHRGTPSSPVGGKHGMNVLEKQISLKVNICEEWRDKWIVDEKAQMGNSNEKMDEEGKDEVEGRL